MLTRNEISARYRRHHPERVRAARAAWAIKNPTYYKDKAKEYRQTRPAHMKAIRLKHRYGQPPSRPAPAKCECCGRRFEDLSTHHGACFDHNHKTGKFRGWLCNDCNIALGRLGDTKKGVLKLLRYLEHCELLS